MRRFFRIFCTATALFCMAALFGGCKEEPTPAPTPEPVPEYIEGREVVSAEEVSRYGDAVRLFGRTYLFRDRLCLDNAATGFEVTFYGTKLTAAITPMTDLLYCRTFLDGDTEGTFFHLTQDKVYTLAENLTEGIHTLRFVKSTSSQNGVIRVGALSTDGKFLRPEKTSPLRIEFVGDSITVGAGIFGTPAEPCTVKNSDATKSYAYLTAQALGADASLVATEGICTKAKFVLPVSSIEMYGAISSVTVGKYQYTSPHDIVVIALGTNDGSYMNTHPEYKKADFIADYRELLGLVREKNPEAKIVCVYGMMGTVPDIADGIREAIAGESNVSYLPLPTDKHGGEGHPSSEGAAAESDVLLEYLRTLL